MDRFVNKKIEKQTIYEIYRACRLCGAGGGYKMPIIQNVMNLEGCDVELKQKIRECVQIEVHQGDKMPPLICELCVDKVNDFYEFLEMCRQTNKRTRLKLGLPPQMLPRGAPDAGECILGVTEPICVNDEDSDEPLMDKKSKLKGGKVIKKEPEKKYKEVRIKLEDTLSPRESRSVRIRPPSPPRLRGDRRPDKASMTSNSRLQTKVKKSQSPPPKSILKKGTPKKPEPIMQPPNTRFKRSREADVKTEVPTKRVKISLKSLPRKPQKRAVSPKQRRAEADRKLARRKEAERKQREMEKKEREAERLAKELQTPCTVCGVVYKTMHAMFSHRRSHVVTYTNPKLACNACALWFSSAEETEAHHKRHRRQSLKYRCGRCERSYNTPHAYDQHIVNDVCVEIEELPGLKCASCWKFFPAQNVLDRHRCPGQSGRPNKCAKCGKTCSTKQALSNHTKFCKKGTAHVDPALLARLRPLRVRVAKCDPLLANLKRGHYDVSAVSDNFGLDKNCVYPYISSLIIKSEPTDCMVKINDMDFGSYVHWDSNDETGESDAETLDVGFFTRKRKVDSLTALALKSIFSTRFLGKVPRKFRRVKIESIINYALNDSLSDLNINDSESVKDIPVSDDKINDVHKKVDEKDDGDDLFPKISSVDMITNDDFDSLFSVNDKSSNDDSVKHSISISDDKLTDNNSDQSKSVCDNLVSGAKDYLISSSNKSVELNNESTNKNNEQNIGSESSNSEEQPQKCLPDEETDDPVHKVSLKVDCNDDIEKDITEENENKINDTLDVNLNLNVITNHTSDESIQKENAENSEESEESLKNQESEEARSCTENKLPLPNDNVLHANHDETKSSDDKLEDPIEENIEKSEENEKMETEAHTEDEDENNENDKNTNEANSIDHTKDNDLNTINDYKNTREVNSREHEKENDSDSNVKVNDSGKDISKTPANGDSNLDEDNFNMDDLEDFSDTEFDDNELMDELDAQIGEKKLEPDVNRTEVNKEETGSKEIEKDNIVNKEIDISAKGTDVSVNAESNINEKVNEESIKDKIDNETENEIKQDKITLEDLLPKENAKPMDLDSISDDEFDFND